MSKTLFHGPHTLKIAKLPVPAATTNDKCCVACTMWVLDIISSTSGCASSIIYIPLSQLSQYSFSHSTRSREAFPHRSHKTAN